MASAQPRVATQLLVNEGRIGMMLKWIIPLALGVIVLGVWEALVRIQDIPPYVLPGPSAIWAALVGNFASLMESLWTTLRITIEAFVLAVAGGVGLAILFSQ